MNFEKMKKDMKVTNNDTDSYFFIGFGLFIEKNNNVIYTRALSQWRL
jgi:hypothetical protein